MILIAAAALSVFGLALFVVGLAFDNPGIAMVGALFIIGIGAAGAIDGYDVKTGEVESVNETTNTTTVNATYDEVNAHGEFPLGVMVTLAGAVLFIGASTRAADT